jgi:fermentation-respiration switch protein FrsA (DUF1100 family)
MVLAGTSGCVNRMFYYPNSVEYRDPVTMNAPVRDVYFTSSDGTRLHGWFVEATTEPTHGTVVHFHGNAQNLTAHSSFVDWLPGAGFNVFLFDYRGFGRSEGRPSRQGLYDDGIAALQEVRQFPEVDTNRIVILGQSLGGATALAVAGRNPDLRGQALIIDSSFSSYRQIVRDKIRLFPILSWFRVPLSYILISNRYSPDATVADIAPTPILFMHGTADPVIPIRHSQTLFNKAGEPKNSLVIPGGGHCSGLITHRDDVAPCVVQFMKDALEPD